MFRCHSCAGQDIERREDEEKNNKTLHDGIRKKRWKKNTIKRRRKIRKLLFLCCLHVCNFQETFQSQDVTPVSLLMFNLLKPSGNFTYHQV
jgi:hypothetical protein